MLTIVSNLEVWRGTAARVLVSTEKGCPCCGSKKIREFEFEWEISGFPVHVEQACSACEWAQGWDPTHQWVRLPVPPGPAEVICTAG